ncbi:dethiobiotin synthetase [Nonlabens ulvanivorans]|uniref:ATP-dependent dethiobiotin synthetase BioD n=1 Tax=Nonlabens ulvanivorans TaxID=906888 RepID=A0A081D6P5_NONUL|nr:dethiobiotin synthase [Nonlabens ulvanivorans]GAK74591.1 dethiobiotin synthetase [Nonlabens ulvanivorans]GAK98458.1 dethiobiotin synthetase [Nonlabens ulvanivorans]
MNSYFITGISTDVGKTLVAAAITQALEADYWKPIQSGGIEHSDRMEVQRLISNNDTVFHKERYFLETPMSPHEAAAIDGITIELEEIKRPQTENNLVIEGAGGLLVPLNDKHTIIDLIQPTDKVILVSSGYLGSINHTLLSIEVLRSRGLSCAGMIYNQVELSGTIEIIEKMTGVPTIAHLSYIDSLNNDSVAAVARTMREKLLAI